MNAIFALLLVVTACASTETDFVAVEYSSTSPLTFFLLDPFEIPIGHSLVLSDVGRKVLERFGEPDSTDITYEVDRYGAEGSRNRISTLHYPGLAIQIGDRAGTGNENVWLIEIELTGKQHRLKYALGIGAKHEDVLNALRPTSYNDSSKVLTMREEIWEKRFGNAAEEDIQVGTTARLRIEFDSSDQVNKIVWSYGGH